MKDPTSTPPVPPAAATTPAAPGSPAAAMPDDPRWEPGMPVLDRQGHPGAVPAAHAAREVPRSVPETKPTWLQGQYVYLSVVVFLCGLVAISALELGAAVSSLVVKVPVLIGAPILVVTTADAILRIWRSAWAWMPVNRGRGLFRLAWVAVSSIGLLALVAGSWLVITA